jgi:phosphoglycolate phosphatase-like HAD superfamily hydrolase
MIKQTTPHSKHLTGEPIEIHARHRATGHLYHIHTGRNTGMLRRLIDNLDMDFYSQVVVIQDGDLVPAVAWASIF